MNFFREGILDISDAISTDSLAHHSYFTVSFLFHKMKTCNKILWVFWFHLQYHEALPVSNHSDAKGTQSQ